MKKIKEIVQAILSNPVVSAIQRMLLWLGSRNRLSSMLYSLVFFIPFGREQHANIAGRYKYYKHLKQPGRTSSALRRNVHRLEKGLSARDRRDSFGSRFIGETVAVYKKASMQETAIDLEETAWAQAVLEEYFQAVDNADSRIATARKVFETIEHRYTEENNRKPFTSKSRTGTDITYEQFLQLAQHRRSVRWFEDEKVPRDLLDKALLAGRQSPSACNRLPYEFRFYDDPELVKKIAGLPFGAAGYADNIPTIAVVIGKLDNYFSSRDRHAMYIDASLAAMPFMMALETLGLSSSVINWPDFEPLEIKMQKTLGTEVSDRVLFLIAIGYSDPEGYIPYSQKKELDTIRNFNHIGL